MKQGSRLVGYGLFIDAKCCGHRVECDVDQALGPVGCGASQPIASIFAALAADFDLTPHKVQESRFLCFQANMAHMPCARLLSSQARRRQLQREHDRAVVVAVESTDRPRRAPQHPEPYSKLRGHEAMPAECESVSWCR